jgi:hypothetical protein
VAAVGVVPFLVAEQGAVSFEPGDIGKAAGVVGVAIEVGAAAQGGVLAAEGDDAAATSSQATKSVPT